MRAPCSPLFECDTNDVANLQLREGMLVGAGGGAVMIFVLEDSATNHGVIVAAFNQKNFLRLKPGQYAEVALHGYPGQIFTGRVVNAIDVSGAGQLTASGILPSDFRGSQPTLFAARIKLDNSDDLRLPGGSQAQVAVYTEDVQIAGIPVMFLIRAQSWLRYVMYAHFLPWNLDRLSCEVFCFVRFDLLSDRAQRQLRSLFQKSPGLESQPGQCEIKALQMTHFGVPSITITNRCDSFGGHDRTGQNAGLTEKRLHE